MAGHFQGEHFMQIIRSITPVALVLALCAALLSLTSTTASARADEEMTTELAGREYLSVLCAANRATDTFTNKIWRGREQLQMDEVRRRLPELKRLARTLSRAESNAARGFFNPPAPWPAFVASDTRVVANAFLRSADISLRQGSAYNAGEWARLNERGNQLNNVLIRVSRKIRAKLDLPPPGEGC